jgi:hypothetical protein
MTKGTRAEGRCRRKYSAVILHSSSLALVPLFHLQKIEGCLFLRSRLPNRGVLKRTLAHRLMAGLQILVLCVLVRIQLGQQSNPFRKERIFCFKETEAMPDAFFDQSQT